MLDSTQKRRVRETFAHVSQDSVGTAFDFYDALFAACPHLRGLFPEDMAPQTAKFANSLSALIASLEAESLPVDYLRDLGARHADRGVRPEHYPPVCASFLDTLSETPGWGPDQAAAWSRLLTLVTQAMTSGSRRRCA